MHPVRISIVLLVGVLLLAAAGCIPQQQAAVATYTVDPLLLQSLQALVMSSTPTATPSLPPSATPTPRKPATATGQVKPTKAGSATSQPVSRLGSPTKTPTNTRTPKPSQTPTIAGPTQTPAPQDAAIRIYQPSSLSKLVSPFNVVMSVIPGTRGNVYMKIIGERSETIYERKWVFPLSGGHRTNINESIEFTIPALSESARLVVYTYDEYNRMMSLASEDIILLSIGKQDLTEPDNLMDPFALLRPYPDQVVKKGDLIINGMTHCRMDCRLFFEVVDVNGQQLATKEQSGIMQASLDYQPFNDEMVVKVKSPTVVRLILHQQNIFTQEDIAVSSVVVKLMP
jgi:hypothetical protein